MGESNSGKAVEIKLRWPPFDSHAVIASELPVAQEYFHLTDSSELPSNAEIGCESGFHVHRKVINLPDGLQESREWHTLSDRIPGRVERERRGWFLLPSKMHRTSRKLIPYAVIGIIASLAIVA